MATIPLATDSGIRARFSPQVIQSGQVSCAICSVGMKDGTKIICPRRLLNFGQNGFSPKHLHLVQLICRIAGFSAGATIDFWTELSLNFRQGDLRFQYRLDYVLRERLFDGQHGPPIVVEVMTCSTSGGNKSQGTDIQTAFRKALLANQGDEILCPGINIRQVWARMASQLIVKSQAVLAWGGRTIWVVQDVLGNYVANNTGLKLSQMQSNSPGEVNIIASTGFSEDVPILYSGPITSAIDDGPSFSDILKAPFVPDREAFLSKVPKIPSGSFKAPGH